MGSVALAVPAPLDARTGGSIYDRRLVDGLRRRGWTVRVVELDRSFPFPTPDALAHAERALGDIPTDTVTIVDSLALGAMPDVIVREGARLPIVALMHLPLAADVSLKHEAAELFAGAERRALTATRLTIVTGDAALPLLSRYDLPPDRIIVIEPGTDRAPLAHGSTGGRVELLSVGTLNPIKGHLVLIDALASVTGSEWHLTCAGSLTRDSQTVERVQTAIAARGLNDCVTLTGDLDATGLAACYDRADLFVLATRQETYGMAVAEALAHGLPVVATRTGAIPRLVGESAGVLVPTDDRDALAEALSRAIGDGAHRARLAEGARRIRERLPTWDITVDRFAGVLRGLSHG